MPDLLAWVAEQGYPLDPEQWPEGEELPEDLPLFVGFEVAAGDESMRGIKRVKVRLDSTSGDNGNPVLTGLEIDGVPVGDYNPRIEAGSKVMMAPLVDEASRDSYVPEGESEAKLDDFLFSWFCSAGSFLDERSILDVDSQGRRLDTNEYRAPEELGPATLWLVVRDARFGTDWMSWQVEIVEALALVE